MVFSPADTQEKAHLENLSVCRFLSYIPHSCNAIFFCWHPQDQGAQYLKWVHTSSGTSCPAKAFHMTTPAPAQTGNTELLPTSLLTLRNILYFLLSSLFTWPGAGLASAWLWDLCVVIDCLAGETRHLSVELLQQFVTTQIYPSPLCHKSYRNINLGDVYCFVKFSDQQVWKLCGRQNTDVHPHKLLVWSQEMM